MFSGFKDVEFRTSDGFVTLDRVVSESVVFLEIAEAGFMPYPVGAKVETRLAHIFRLVLEI